MAKSVAKKSNLLNGVVVPSTNPADMAFGLVESVREAKSVAEQVTIKFDLLNKKVAEVVQSGIEFGSTNAKAHESIMASLVDGQPVFPVNTSFATMLWVCFELDGYTTGNAKQVASLVSYAVRHKVRILPGLMNLQKFIDHSITKGVPALEDANKIVRIKASGKSKAKRKAGTGTRTARTDVHASKGLTMAMTQEGFASLLRGIVNELDFESLSDDGIIESIWSYLVTLKHATKDDKGVYRLAK